MNVFILVFLSILWNRNDFGRCIASLRLRIVQNINTFIYLSFSFSFSSAQGHVSSVRWLTSAANAVRRGSLFIAVPHITIQYALDIFTSSFAP
jgi:hypothetical protein